jgi:uncharacterized protein YdhG (YjbR/CyaY superfamily)
MKRSATPIETIDQYIAKFSPSEQKILQEVRNCIQAAAPEATEAIKYQMPTFCQHGNLIHFAMCKEHLGVYPTPSAIVQFAKELEPYTTSKGAVQFPLSKKMPLALIKKMTKFRVEETLKKAATKKKS